MSVPDHGPNQRRVIGSSEAGTEFLPVSPLERQTTKRREFFPLQVRKGWQSLPEVVRSVFIALLLIHLTLAILWIFYRFLGW